jgi:hypothetical protein
MSRDFVTRGQIRAEQQRRDRIQEQRLAALREWLASPPVVPPLPEKYMCLSCQRSYARGEPGSTWRFCAECLRGNDATVPVSAMRQDVPTAEAELFLL